MLDKTNLSELAQFFPASGGSSRLSRSSSPVKVTTVSSRYWLPGDTYQQALARQREDRARIEVKIAARKSTAAAGTL